MGCGLGRKKVTLQVDFCMEETGDSHYDSLFHELELPLSKLAKTHYRLTAALKDFQREVGTLRLLKSPTFFDSLMAMLFCFSASGQGSLETIAFELTPTLPFIQVNTRLLYMEHRKIVPAWARVMAQASKAPRRLAVLLPIVETALLETAGELYVGIPRESEPESSGSVDPFEQQMRRTLASNYSKLHQAEWLVEEIRALVLDVNKTVEALPQILCDGQAAILAVGQQAFVDQKLTPKDIVDLYWPTARTQSQLHC